MFNAKELDEESGMYYYEARYYAPPTFISRDPLFEKYPFISPYAYCANNPVIYIDPTGLTAEEPITNPPDDPPWKNGLFNKDACSVKDWFTSNSSNIEDKPMDVSQLSISTKGLDFLVRNEGVRTEPYNDSKGYATIGVGHLIAKRAVNEQDKKDWAGFTKEKAMDLLKKDITKVENAVRDNVNVKLTQNQYDAIVSFAFNVGIGGFKKSEFLSELNKGNYNGDLMLNFSKPSAIVPRRKREVELFNNGTYK
jgi:RHS repeat-associated protein